jgi:hypothetical protein
MSLSPALSDHSYVRDHVGNLNHEDLYILGIARARTNAPLAKLLSLLITTKAALKPEIYNLLCAGNLEAAYQMVNIDAEQTLPTLVKAESLSDKLRLTLERSTSFPDSIEVEGTRYAQNPTTGEIMEP